MSVLVYCSFLSIFSIKIFDWGLGGGGCIIITLKYIGKATKKSFGSKKFFGTGPEAIKVGPPENTGI